MGAIGGANMWALLLDKDPGHSATAGDLAVDIVDGKLKKAAAVTTVKVEEAPQTGNVAKPGKGGAAFAEVAKLVKRGIMVTRERKGAAGDDKQAPASVDCGQVQMNGAGYSKLAAAAAAATVPTSTGRDEVKGRQAALPSKEEGQAVEPKEEVFEVVTGRGGRRRSVDTETLHKAAVPVAVVTGTNMWALLSDDDPGHGGASAMPTKRGKKTKKEKKKKKKNAAKLEETPASELEEMGEEEEEMSGKAATVGSHYRTMASGMFWAALAVAMLILFFDATA